MEEIKSILKGSNGLQRISHLTGAANVVSGEIRSRLRHLNQSVDRKVEDLYHNIIGNFSRTVLPAANPRTDELQPARICVDGSKSGGKSCRELIPLRKKKQMDEVVTVRQQPNKRDDKQNDELEATPIVAQKTKLHTPDEKRAFVEIRLERTVKDIVSLPNINRAANNKARNEQKPLKPIEVNSQGQSFNIRSVLNERALLDKYDSETFKVVNHEVDNSTMEFLNFQRANHMGWDAILAALNSLMEFSKKHSFPDSNIEQKQIVWLSKLPLPHRKEDMLLCFSDVEDVLTASPSRQLRYEGKVGRLRAVLRIQSWFRTSRQVKQYRKYKSLLVSIKKIQDQWRCYCRLKKTREQIRQNSNLILEKFQQKQTAFRKNWTKIQGEQRVQIHISSTFISELKRLTSQKFLQKENCQITRIFRLSDPQLSIIYVSPIPLSDDLISYYTKVLQISQVSNAKNRLTLVWPEVRPSDCGCVCQNLLYSPKCMKRIKSIIGNKTAYLVPGYPSNTYLRLAHILNVPIYGGLPNKCRYLSSKSGIRSLSKRNLPCEINLYTVDQVVRSLADLIMRYPKVQRWYFKIDDETNARGNAYVDVRWMKKFRAAHPQLAEQGNQQLVEVLRGLLPKTLRVVHKNLFKSYDEFMAAFITAGGVIQASPVRPESQVRTSTYLLQIQPDGVLIKLSSYDRIYWQLKPIGSSYPSKFSLPQQELQSVGKKLYRKGVIGYVSVDYLNCSEEQYWLVGVDCYLTNLSAVYFTAKAIGRCRAIQELPLESKVVSKTQVADDQVRFIYCPIITHNGIAELQMRAFFHLCRLANISFDINRRIGSVFILMDSLQSSTLGLLSFCDNDYGLHRYITNALDFLSSRLDPKRNNSINDTRTDYISFEQLKNRFRTLLKKFEKGKERARTEHLQLVQ